jgi:bacteriorhodopsin
MRKVVGLMSLAAASAPLIVAAQDLEGVVRTAKNIVDAVVPLFMVLAVAVFLWGIVKYITAGGNPEKEKSARGFIVYGLIGIFVLVAFWGIIQIVANTFGIQPGASPQFPDINVPG